VQHEVNALGVPYPAPSAVSSIFPLQMLYAAGVRSFLVLGIGPLGCTPLVRTVSFWTWGRCNPTANAAAEWLNQGLAAALEDLRHWAPDASLLMLHAKQAFARAIQLSGGSPFFLSALPYCTQKKKKKKKRNLSSTCPLRFHGEEVISGGLCSPFPKSTSDQPRVKHPFGPAPSVQGFLRHAAPVAGGLVAPERCCSAGQAFCSSGVRLANLPRRGRKVGPPMPIG